MGRKLVKGKEKKHRASQIVVDGKVSLPCEEKRAVAE